MITLKITQQGSLVRCEVYVDDEIDYTVVDTWDNAMQAIKMRYIVR